jgi:hypothetical protein
MDFIGPPVDRLSFQLLTLAQRCCPRDVDLDDLARIGLPGPGQ